MFAASLVAAALTLEVGSGAAHMQSMGRVLRWMTAGESHGRALVTVVEGMVAGVGVTSSDISEQLALQEAGVRPRGADEVRAGPGDGAGRCAARQHSGRPHRCRNQQQRVAGSGNR